MTGKGGTGKTKPQVACPQCRTLAFSGARFCGSCGLKLEIQGEDTNEVLRRDRERKYVTVLFADISGYTAMAQRLDPEDVGDIVRRVFGEIAGIISKYGGSIEKYAGDAIMAVFGVPKSHEDDPLRAVKAAGEIHHSMEASNRWIQAGMENPLSMHIGINTGLVVTSELNVENGMVGVSGDTVNLASRLCDIAAPLETLVAHSTYAQAQGFFNFEPPQPIEIRGRTGSLLIYRVLSPKELPSKVHRLSGLRSGLVGRKEEMALLAEAADGLAQGRGAIFSICGDAGTGKSRLIEEFKSTLGLDALQWLEGHSYAYTQNIPYYPLIDLFNRAFEIKEWDPPEVVKEKAEAGINALIGDRRDIIPYLGDLLSISYPETENLSPENWKFLVHKAARVVLSALLRKAPTIICLEDLHWADPSSMDLLRFIICETGYPALFLCAYRPPLDLFADHHFGAMNGAHHEIRLQDLSPPEMMEMVGSLLGVEDVPADLERFMFEKAEGNPFYVEEVINSLIESEALKPGTGWRLSPSIGKLDIPATVRGVVSARVDRLDSAAKLMLQEASVIGKTFPYGVIERITTLDAPDRLLDRLEKLDLVRTTSLHPDREYSFKHSLTREAVYNGLLIKHRKDIHERVGLAMEQVFRDRLSEYWETLGHHFKQGRSITRAIDYLIKSGGKSFRRCALEESHRHYKEALDLLLLNTGRSGEEDVLLVDLLIRWALVFYYRGCFRDLTELLKTHEAMVELLDDRAKAGMFYAWLGFAVFGQGENLDDSYRYLHKALELGELAQDRQVIGYSCAFLVKTCAELGLMEEAACFQQRSRELLDLFPSDGSIYHYCTGTAAVAWFTGEKGVLFESARVLLDCGREKSNIRLLTTGSIVKSLYHHVNSDFRSAAACLLEMLKATLDPYHEQFANGLLGMFYIQLHELEAAEKVLREVIEFSDKTGNEYLKTHAKLFLGVALAGQGHLSPGFRLIKESTRQFLSCRRKVFYGLAEFILGNVYLHMLQGPELKSFSLVLRNLGFLIVNRPTAAGKALGHLEKAVQVLSEAGARGLLGEPYLQLSLLHKLKGRAEKAGECAREALLMFEQCGSEANARRAGEILESLGLS